MPATERHRRQRGKNLVLAWVLFALVVLFFAITLARMGGAS
jgi:hypothetical protein